MATTRRQRQAEETRREIGAAARRLFAEQGYAATSMAQIAAAAGVSVQTIYDSIGSKAAIVATLNDLIDVEGDVPALVARIPETTDPRQLLDIAVTISHNLNERCADIAAALFSAATVEPTLAELRDEGRSRHHEGTRRLAARLASLGALKPGLEPKEAGDVIAVLTDPQVVQTMVQAYGWSWDRWHEWTLDTLCTLVLSSGTWRPAPRSR